MKKPIFVVGANRSGTTLLRLILNSHSEIAIPDELVYFRGYKFNLGRHNWKRSTMGHDEYDYFVRSFLSRNVEALAPLDTDRLAEEILSEGEPNVQRPYQCALEAWARAHGKSRWGEKTPGNLFFARDIKMMFPDAQFIYMVRDPRAGALSMQRATIYSTDIVMNAHNRRHYMSAGLRSLESVVPAADRTVVRYEDLVTDPEGTTRALCRFLGIDYEPAMLEYHETASRFMKSRAATDINADANRPIQDTKAESWKSEMSPRDIAVVEHVCHDVMHRHGYEPSEYRLSAADRLTVSVRGAYWRYQMWKHRESPGYQVMHGFMPRFREEAQAGRSIAA